MENYKQLKNIGSGSYGTVWKALNRQNNGVVAIKKLNKRYASMDDCLNLMEVKSLRKMNHPNIIKLLEIVKQNDILFMVFEYMDCSLYQRMSDPTKPRLSESKIRNLCFQLFQGLGHMHSNGYFHRDLKPENLLVSKDDAIIKIADLGQARETNGKPPFTDYVTTRWYRAPEVLLYSRVYDSSVDMWAMGAIMAELFNLQPLFQGDNAMQVMYRICSVIGSPTPSAWPIGHHLANSINYQFPADLPGVRLAQVLPSASEDAINLISALLSWNPCLRPTIREVLDHPFFYSCYPSLSTQQNLPLVFEVARQNESRKPSTSLQNCCETSSKETTQDLMSLLPKDLFEFY